MNLFQSDEKSGLEKTINELIEKMRTVEPDSKEYATMADQLVKLYNLKEVDSKRKISKDTLIVVVGNLAGIGLIILFEKEHVMSSKALQFLKTLVK